MIHHASRCTHNDVDTATQSAKLDLIVLAAIYRDDTQPFHAAGIGFEGLCHLYRQFPSRCENQDLRSFLVKFKTR